jgi:hypothetical protein
MELRKNTVMSVSAMFGPLARHEHLIALIIVPSQRALTVGTTDYSLHSLQ